MTDADARDMHALALGQSQAVSPPEADVIEALRLAEDELHGSDSPAFNAVCRALSRLEASQPASEGSDRPPKRDIGIIGPVDGMNSPDLSGSYFRVVLTGKRDELEEYLISLGAAEIMLAETAGLFETTPSPAAETAPDAGLAGELVKYLGDINRRASADPQRTFEDAERDLRHIGALARAALSRAGERT